MLVLLSTLAQADDAHVVSVTWSPLHLISGTVELTAEARLAPRVGAALIGGRGSMDSGDYIFPTWEVGAQLRGYLTGGFDGGLYVAGEALFLGVSEENTDAAGSAFALGPLAGAKHAWDFGLTVDGGLGVAMLTAKATVGSLTRKETTVGPILNLNVGWSF